MQALAKLGEEITDEEAAGIIEAVDKDGDGHISYDGNLLFSPIEAAVECNQCI